MMAGALRFPHHVELYRYWDAKRDGRPMPSRCDFDPCQVSALLSHLMIVDKFAGRFRYRLVGTVVADDMGRDLTGSRILESCARRRESPSGSSAAATKPGYDRPLNFRGRCLYSGARDGLGHQRSPPHDRQNHFCRWNFNSWNRCAERLHNDLPWPS